MSTENRGPGRRAQGRGFRGAAVQQSTPPVGASSESSSSSSMGVSIGRGMGRTRAIEQEAARRTSPSGTPPEGDTPKSGSPAMGDTIDKMKEMKILDLIKRPGYGTLGRKINVYANHFEVRMNKMLNVLHYHVDISHERIKLTFEDNRNIFWRFVKSQSPKFPSRYRLAYDGAHFCVALDSLPEVGTGATPKIFQFNTQLIRNDREEPFQLKFQFTSYINVDAKNVQTAAVTERYTTALQVMDILFRQQRSCPDEAVSAHWYPHGNSLYKVQEHGTDLGCGRMIWQGLFGATRIGDNYMPLFNFDVSNSGFHKFGGTVIDYMVEVLNARCGRGGNQFHVNQLTADKNLSEQWRFIVQKELKGLKIRMVSRRANGEQYEREYPVLGVMPESAASKTFDIANPDGTKRTVTVAQYFKEKYGPLTYPGMNLLQIGRKSRSMSVPMERCKIAPSQRVKSLSKEQTTTMIRNAAISAQTRKQKIDSLVAESQFAVDPWLKEFGVQINSRMATVNARILPPMKVRYSQNPQDIVEPRDGVWQCKNKKFYTPAGCQNIYALIFDRKESMYSEFFTFLLRTCNAFGMAVPPTMNPNNMVFGNPQEGTKIVEPMIKDIVQRGAQLIFVVIPMKGSPFYPEVKRVAEIVVGVMTQCVVVDNVRKTVSKGDVMTMTNIALKVNTKLGGVNSLVEMEKSAESALKLEPTMVLGIDVTHPAPNEQRAPSIAGIVGNLDSTFMRYGASIRVQKHRRESVVYMQDPIRERLVEFFRYTSSPDKPGKQPKRIIIYRDGVAEGQFQELLREEIGGIREACRQLGENYRPKLTVIVAQKRHHTRFFPMDARDGCGRAGNVHPGTVVERTITHPDQFEFYMVSHFGIQGTSRPIRYHVLLDENGYSADQIQQITHYLCHMYARCTRIVSIPAPVYYADLACRRARAHLHNKITEFGSDTMSQARGDTNTSSISEEELVRSSTIEAKLKMRMYFA